MWRNKCCNDTNIKGGLLSSDPTSQDINYPPGFIGWTEEDKIYFHTGSGNWVDISKSGSGSDGVNSINGEKGSITFTAKDPLKITQSGKNFDISIEIPAAKYTPIPFETFITDKIAESNHAYAAIDSKNTLAIQLPARGSFKRGDIIEVENLSASAFKITLNNNLIIRYDDKIIEDIDGKFLLSQGPGSSIKLRAESTQLWYVVRRDRVSISFNQ